MRRVAVLALCLFPSLVVAQEDDRGFLTRMIEENLSGDNHSVRIDGFQGALSSRARMSALTISDDEGPWLTLRDVVLDWNRSALFTGRVQVNSLTAAEINFDRLPNPGDSIEVPNPEVKPFALPDLPVSLQIGQLNADVIRLGESILGEPITAKLEGGANLADGEGNARLALTRTDGKLGVVALEGGFVNASRKLKIDLSLQEQAGGIASTKIGLPGAPALDLTISGEAPLEDFTADVALRSDGQPRFAGKVRLGSQPDGAQTFGLDLKGDVTPLFLPEYRSFFGPDVALFAVGNRTADGATQLEALRLNAAALKVEGAAVIAADGLPQSLDLKIDMANADGSAVLLPLSGDPVRLDKADLVLVFDAASGGDRWTLSGEIAGLDTLAMQAENFRLNGQGRIAHNDLGRQMVDGTLDFRGSAIAMTDAALQRAIGPEITGHTNFAWTEGEALQIPQLTLKGPGYGAEATISIDGDFANLALNGDVKAEIEDLARLSGLAGREMGGAGAVTWSGTVTPLIGAFDGVATVTGRDISLDLPEADALLRGDSTIRLDAARGAEGIHLRGLDVAAQTLSVKADGWVRATGPDLKARLDFADLSVLGGGRAGRLGADAVLKGSAFDNDITLAIKGLGQNLRSGIAQADGFLQGDVTLDGAVHLLDKVVTVNRLALAGPGWGATASGTVADTARDLVAQFRVDDLRPAGGGIAGGISGDLTYTMQGGREVAALEAVANGLAIGQPEADRVLRGTTRLSTKASREGETIRLEGLQLDNPQLTARADANQNGDQRQVDLNARLNDMALIVPGVPGALVTQGRIEENQGQLTINLNTTGPGGINVTTAGTAALNFASTNLTIKGSSDAALANAFLGNALAVRGPVQLDLAVNGKPGLEALSGRVGINGGRLSLTSPAMTFSDITGAANMSGGRMQLDMRARSEAGGAVSITGPITLAAPFNGDLRIVLDSLVLRDPNLYETTMRGMISVAGALTGGARISGALELGDTELRIPSTGLGGTAAIPDLRHIREPAPVRRTRARAGLLDEGGGAQSGGPSRAFPLDISISAPNRVFIRGRGLDAELGGAFRITGTTANIVPAGGLELVRGRLDLLGKRFAFTEGQMNMEGSLVPTIRLVATTDTVDGSASVIIDGPADAPVITFSSSPELPEEEVVARLLFGRGMTSLTPLQAAQLASAVATLTGRGGGMMDRLRQNFGLDDFDVSASESGAAAVRAGKYISDSVYVDLKLDSEGKSEVSINLDVSKSVTVRGRAGADGNTGVGVHYERDY